MMPYLNFKDGIPAKGKPELSFRWMDATWRFSSAENINAFKAEPARYAPQYGGCAFGTSQGHLVPGDAQAWKTVDGKLYLNYNQDVMSFWMQDVPGNIQKADENWPKLRKQPPGWCYAETGFGSPQPISDGRMLPPR